MNLHRRLLIISAMLLVAGCTTRPDPAIAETAARYLNAEASQNCPELRRLTAPGPTDPCADLADRALRLSMMEASDKWQTSQNGDRARAETVIGENVEITYNLRRIDTNWLVEYPH